MYVWIMYDVRADKARRRVARLCKQAGLHRVQQSVFLGKVKARRLREVYETAKTLLNPETDRICLLEITRASFRKMRQTGMPEQLPSKGDIFFF